MSPRETPRAFRDGDRVRLAASGRMGYVSDRQATEKLGDRYRVDWDGGLDYSLVEPGELELVWPVGRDGTNGRGRRDRDASSAAD